MTPIYTPILILEREIDLHDLASKLLAVKTLTSRERHILQLKYGIGHPTMKVEEIADVYDVSVDRIRQIERKALYKITRWVTMTYSPFHKERLFDAIYL